VNRVERVRMEETFVQLAADAIGHRHPQADWLAGHGRFGDTGLTDRALEAAVERLGAWLASRRDPGQG
jgi:hypothetical protein